MKYVVLIITGIAIGLGSHYLTWLWFSYLIAGLYIVLGITGVLGIIHIFRKINFFPRLAEALLIIFLFAFFTGITQFKIRSNIYESQENKFVATLDNYVATHQHLPATISEFDTTSQFEGFEFVPGDSLSYNVKHIVPTADKPEIRLYSSTDKTWRISD